MSSAPLLSLFLLDETKFIGNESHYVMALYDRTDSSHPYVPLGLSHNVHSNRMAIINEIEKFEDDLLNPGRKESKSRTFTEGRSPLEGLKKHIGHNIMTNLHMFKIFEMLWKRKRDEGLDQICIVTNDHKIPWEWAYNKNTDEFFCEAFSCGKLFFEYIKDYYNFLFLSDRKRKSFSDDNEVNAEIRKSHAVLLYDDWGKNGPNCLDSVEQEINSIHQALRSKNFQDENIHTIDGKDRDAESNFLHCLTMLASDSARIIHYAGHISRDGILLRHGTIEPEELESISSLGEKRLLAGKPIVFLNGCYSAHIIDVWEHQRNLSTVFTKLGASGTICSYLPLADKISAEFAQIFYKNLLEIDQPVGSALRKARNEIAKKYASQSNRSALAWLFYTLHGDPSIRLFPKKTPKEIEEESYQKAREFDEIGMLRELKKLDSSKS